MFRYKHLNFVFRIQLIERSLHVKCRLALSVAFAAVCTVASATTYPCSTATELTNAVAVAVAGDEIVLAAGTYGIEYQLLPQAAITLRAADGVAREDCVITNIATTFAPGTRLLYLNNAGSVVSGITFTGGHALNRSGGAILIGNVDVTVSNCVFRGNVADAADGTSSIQGGAVSCNDNKPVFYDCLFEDNHSIGKNSKNVGIANAGALAYGVAYRCKFIGNTASAHGGAVFAGRWCDCLFMYNCASYGGNNGRGTAGYGGDQGAGQRNATWGYFNCDVISNGYTRAGVKSTAGSYGATAMSYVHNSIVFDNNGGNGNSVMKNCVVDSVSGGITLTDGTLLTSAEIRAVLNPDFTLTAAATDMIDMGAMNIDGQTLPSAVRPIDLAGNPRVANTVDIGCFEKIGYDISEAACTVEVVANDVTDKREFTLTLLAPYGTFDYTLDFGDGGEKATGTFVSSSDNLGVVTTGVIHSYSAGAGNYTATLNVTGRDEYASVNLADTCQDVWILRSNCEVWVSKDGTDSPASGAEDSPFATLDFCFSLIGTNAVVHIIPDDTPYAVSNTLKTLDAVTIIGDPAHPELAILERPTDAAEPYRVIEAAGNLTLRGVVVRGGWLNNSGSVANGAGVYLASGSSGVFEDCWFENNRATVSGSGGAVYALGQATFDRCVFSNNYCTVDGGAIYSAKNATARDSVFLYNKANGGQNAGTGGALATPSGKPFNAYRCRLEGNYASNNSGASCYVTFYDSLLVRNHGNTARGAVTDHGTFYNCTIMDNYDGVAAARNSSFYNCILLRNSGADVGNSCNGYSSTLARTVNSGSLSTFVAVAGDDDLSWIRDDYTLRSASPARNAGNASYYTQTASLRPTDLAGKPRVVGTIDLGCFECDVSGTVFLLR